MITFREFLELAESSTGERGKRRLAPKGPKANRYSRTAQRHDTVDRVALKKAGFKRYSNQDYYPQDHISSSSPHHDTVISTYKNQSDFAKHNIKGKLKNVGRTATGVPKKKVVPTAERVRHLKALKKQLGSDRTSRQVHDVSIHAKDDQEHQKNDPKQLISRGKSFKKEVKAVPSATKQVGGKAGDKVVGRPAEVQSMPDSMPASQKVALRKKGATKRGKIYNKELGGSKTNPKTGLNIGNLK
jgi:hypothetical protein